MDPFPRASTRILRPRRRRLTAPLSALLGLLACLATVLTVVGGFTALDVGPASALSSRWIGDDGGGVSAREQPGVAYDRPTVGSCHLLTHRQAERRSDARPVVPCRGRHTTRTLSAPLVTANLNWSDPEAVSAQATKSCDHALRRALGPDARTRMSAYSYAYFKPTTIALLQGASWLRCDLVLRGRAKLLPLPRRLPQLGRPPFADATAVCLTAPDPATRTTCARPHHLRAVATVRNRARSFPTARRWAAFAGRHCPHVAGRHYFATWPSRAGFERGGERTVVCFARTRH